MAKSNSLIQGETYPGRIALRLRELRASKGFTMTDLQGKLSALGREIPTATLYAYERGKEGGGVDLPHALIPLIARVYDFPHASDWLPKK